MHFGTVVKFQEVRSADVSVLKGGRVDEHGRKWCCAERVAGAQTTLGV